MSPGLQCYNMGHNGHGINLYGVIMTLMGKLHAGGQSILGHLSLLHRHAYILYMKTNVYRLDIILNYWPITK